MAAKAGAAGTIGLLGFMAIWLTGWSVGVGFLQTMSIAEGWPQLFLLTHGGGELVAMAVCISSLSAAADGLVSPPLVEHRHDGVSARWSTGEGAFVAGVLGAGLGLVSHGILFGSLAYAAADASSPGLLLAGVLALVWTLTGFFWSKAVIACLVGGDEVHLEANLDEVSVSQKGRFTERHRQWPLDGLRASHLNDELLLRHRDDETVVPLLGGPGASELVEVLNTMSERSQPAQSVPVPDALKGML